jgi:hypothetical protein
MNNVGFSCIELLVFLAVVASCGTIAGLLRRAMKAQAYKMKPKRRVTEARKSDLRTILAGWIREIVEAQPASFQTLSEKDRKALLEREITRRFHAEYNANSKLFASSCDSEKQRN